MSGNFCPVFPLLALTVKAVESDGRGVWRWVYVLTFPSQTRVTVVTNGRKKDERQIQIDRRGNRGRLMTG